MKDIDKWLANTAWDKLYWSDVEAKAKTLKSDGCTGVTQWLAYTCREHDIHYREHKMINGNVIDKSTADYIFHVRMQQSSPFGWWSPVAWWRWAGVRFLPAAQRAWDHPDKGTPLHNMDD